MKLSLIIILAILFPRSGFCQKKIAFELTPVNFFIRNAGFKVNGSIGDLVGFFIMDSQIIMPIKIEGSIDPNTINTGIALRDSHLKKADYFYVKEFPRIFLTSTHLKNIKANNYTGDFNLTIKDITKSITVPFTFSINNNMCILKSEFSINRLDFKLGEESVILSDSVAIKLDFKANNYNFR